MNVFAKNTDAIRAKRITQILLVRNLFFWMIIHITLEMNIIDYHLNLTS